MTRAATFRTERHTDATLTVDRWSAYLYRTRRDASRELGQAVRGTVRAFQARAVDSRDAAREQRRQAELGDALGRELYASLYNADVAELDAPAAGTELVSKAHELLRGLPEYTSLRAQVQGDPDMAALATAKLLDGVADALPRMARAEREQAAQEAREQLTGRKARNRGPQADPEGELRRALRAAAGKASDAQAQARVALEGLQPGMGATPAAHDQDGTSRMTLAERVTTDPRLQRIMRLAGRLQRLADAGRPQRDEHGCSELVGVTVGGDLPRALPTELGLLRHPRLRRIQLAKIADRRLQQYKLVGQAPQGRGPVVVLLDESSSMDGDRSLWAAAVALACIGVAVRERRPVTVIGFNGGLRYAVAVDAQGQGWEIPVRGYDELDEDAKVRIGKAADVALRVATSRPSGGTSFDPPLRAALALRDGVLGERADLVLVTDGYADASRPTLDALAEARDEQGLRCFGLTVGGGSLGHAVRQLCDSTVDLDRAISSDDAQGVAGAIP